ncbi:MAG: sigma-54-dependent Fis family transcriptional regulator [Planctomycetales bacterium]|nr:sigma-54-dependent Fis family transcriptional regulator [Planctomycetales bacterium]
MTSVELQPGEIRVLVVDNDPAHAQAMLESLEREGYQCAVATSGPEGIKRITSDVFDVVITDLVMNEVDGMGVLARAKEAIPDCEVVMVTGHATVPKAVEAMQQGAYSFLEKPITPSRLRAVVQRAVERLALRRRNIELNQRLDEHFGFEGIIYCSEQMKQVIDRVKRIAPTNSTVLIRGENGTGKELIAQAIHQNSPRKGKRMEAMNIAASTPTLVDSELFGHIKGAFTDAITDRIGAFERANGGTLFFDEVGDMPAATQIKLLRVLEDRKVTRLGDDKAREVNVRVVSATNRDLEELVKEKEFREDLYHRLKVITIDLPPLRDRKDDIVPLVEHFRKHFNKVHERSIRSVTPQVINRLFSHDWPGNIRELRNAMDFMVVMDTDGVVDLDDLPPDFADLEETLAPSSGPATLLGHPMAEIERWAILETLKLTGGNRDEAARILQIGSRTLYRRLQEYNQDKDSEEMT